MTQVFVVAGPAASGKSEFARQLSASLNLDWLDLDDDMEQWLSENQEGIAKIGMEACLAEARTSRYENLLGRAAALVQVKKSVVLSAPFSTEVASSDAWHRLVMKFSGAAVQLIWIDTDPEVRKVRMQSRAAERDAEKTQGYAFERIIPGVEHVAVDGAGDFAQAVAQFAVR